MGCFLLAALRSTQVACPFTRFFDCGHGCELMIRRLPKARSLILLSLRGWRAWRGTPARQSSVFSIMVAMLNSAFRGVYSAMIALAMFLCTCTCCFDCWLLMHVQLPR